MTSPPQGESWLLIIRFEAVKVVHPFAQLRKKVRKLHLQAPGFAFLCPRSFTELLFRAAAYITPSMRSFAPTIQF